MADAEKKYKKKIKRLKPGFLVWEVILTRKDEC